MDLILDPTDAGTMDHGLILNSLGFIPMWLAEAFDRAPDRVIPTVIDDMYGMGSHSSSPQEGFTMLEDGTMLGEGDPPLVPIAEYVPEDQEEQKQQGWVYKVYQYEYGYVNFVRAGIGANAGTELKADIPHMTRMD